MVGVVPPRFVANAKKPITEQVKTAAVFSNKSHTPETKVWGKTGKSRPGDAKKNAVHQIKSKASDTGKTKTADVAEVKTPIAEVSSL